MICSSAPEYGIPLNQPVYDWLASKFMDFDVDLYVIFVLSDRYYSSSPCLNEMGAAWYPHYVLFRRKKTVWNKPYMLFNLTYGCFSLFIEIPKDPNNCTTLEFERMPFPPIPFHTSTEGVWDLSEEESVKGINHSITLTFGAMNDCTENVEITNEKGKPKINFTFDEDEDKKS